MHAQPESTTPSTPTGHTPPYLNLSRGPRTWVRNVLKFCLSVCPTAQLNHLPSSYPSTCSYTCLSACLSVCLSVCPSACLSVCLSVCLIHPSGCLVVCSVSSHFTPPFFSMLISPRLYLHHSRRPSIDYTSHRQPFSSPDYLHAQSFAITCSNMLNIPARPPVSAIQFICVHFQGCTSQPLPHMCNPGYAQ